MSIFLSKIIKQTLMIFNKEGALRFSAQFFAVLCGKKDLNAEIAEFFAKDRREFSLINYL